MRLLAGAIPAAALLIAAASAPLPKGILWQDPGDISGWDFGGSVGGAAVPKPPFTFLREDPSGTQTKVFASDASGATWNVKFGYEVHTESFCWRVVRACGYFAEPNHFVPSGKFENFQPIRRADPTLHADGTFSDARFQFRDSNLKFVDHQNWRWDRPPFGATRELSGLKILIMLFGNWDNKDARVGAAGGPNTAIFQLAGAQGTKFFYGFTDWGAGLGGDNGPSARTDWRCDEFTAQSREFVKGVQNGKVRFGYDGNISEGFQTGIPASHVTWLMQYLGKITDLQLRSGFQASGASGPDADCFTKALRTRIEQLRAVK